jgi:mono/diheme cytochrome c family protein
MTMGLWRTALLAGFVLIAPPALAAEPADSSGPAEVTFNKHIAPIVFGHCASCHRLGEVAPFSLLSYDDARRRAKQIKVVTASGYMPPWKSVKGHGRFVGERRLSPEQIDLIARWADAGAPEGQAGDLPAAPKFADGWKLGPPDIVLTMPEPYSIPAEGPDIYRNFVLSLEVPEGKYIKAVEYRPGNRRVVHHAVCAIEPTGVARKQDEADPEPGFPGSLALPGQLFPGSLAAWTPGRDPLPLPDGLSLPWKAGADLLFQLHLHPSGKPEQEQSQIGLYLTDEPPRRSMVDLLFIDRKIDIPPGERNYRTRDELTLPIEVEAYGIFPHLHMIGREIKITAHPPEGEPFSLLWIDDWDFNWQNFYQYDPPVKLAAGTRLVMDAVHDNSADNFRNPSNPPQRVVWGEQTTDEMSAAVLQLVPVAEADLPKLVAAHRRRILGGITAGELGAGAKPDPQKAKADAQRLLARLDANRDGKLDFDELAAAAGGLSGAVRALAAPFDIDGDGALDLAELEAAVQRLGGLAK